MVANPPNENAGRGATGVGDRPMGGRLLKLGDGAAVERPSLLVGADRIRPLLAIADGIDTRRRDALGDQVLARGVGTPLTERGEWYAGVLPDRISIYMGPTLRYCESREDVVHEVAVTVVHEIAHHFGIDDERLHELGWG